MLAKNRAREQMDQLLSAYIDGALSPRERARLEARLAQDAALRARLESLQQTVALVRGLPPVPAPRNFLLTPALVRQTVPAARRLAPALTFATAVSGLLCIILLMGSLMAAGWNGPGATAPLPMVADQKGPTTSMHYEVQETGEMAQALASSEEGTLPSAAAAPETSVPEMDAWSLETPSLLEEAPPLGGGGAGDGGGAQAIPSLLEGGPPLGGGGAGDGGGAPEPSLREPCEPEEGRFPTPTPELTPPVRVGIAAEDPTPIAIPAAEPIPTPTPVEMPGERPTSPLTSWLPVGGLALLTVVLAVLSLRAWRAR